MKEPAGLESSVSTAERLCQEVGDLPAKVRSTLARVRDTSIPDSISNTLAGILEALAVKPDSEDLLLAAVRRIRRTMTDATSLPRAILLVLVTWLLG
jgi:hypothetical protein